MDRTTEAGHPGLLLALAEVLRERRHPLGLTQEVVGDLHRNTIGAVERAALNPSVTQLVRIAEALQMIGAELLEEAERRQSGAASNH